MLGDGVGGSGANSSPRRDRFSSALLSRCELASSCQCRVPQFRHRRIAPAEFARLELPLLDLLCQLDSRDRYDRVVESLESQHRPDSLLHSPMVLLHQVVQVLAGSNLDATRKFAVCLHLPHRTMRGRIGVQRDLRGHASVLHCAAQKRFGGVHVPVPAQKEIDRLARFVHGAVQVHPLSVNLYIGLVHPPRSADAPSVAPPALFEFWKVALDPPENRCMVTEMPRSAIMITRSRRLSLKLVYQATHKMMICPSKCRPLNRSSIGTNRCISSSSPATLVFAPEPLIGPFDG